MAEDTLKTTILNLKHIKKSQRAKKTGRSPVLVVLTGGQAGQTHKLDDESIHIGRSNSVEITIDDDGVSRLHAIIKRRPDGSMELRDMGSTNGTFCNGLLVETHILKENDKVQVGTTTVLKFTHQDALDEAFTQSQYESVNRDGLTRCYNKKYLNDRLPAEIAFAQRHKKELALVMLDIDHFKIINDTHGHLAGDTVLVQLADMVRLVIRTDDVFTRYGGEEFVLIMRETDVTSAHIVAERIRREIEETGFDLGDYAIDVTISLGISVLTLEEQTSAEELIRQADEYLYKAKRSGRNRTESILSEQAPPLFSAENEEDTNSD